MISCTIQTTFDFTHIHVLCKQELAREHNRSITTLEDKNGQAIFKIEAHDITALRAATNTITSILSMYEKTQEAIHGQK